MAVNTSALRFSIDALTVLRPSGEAAVTANTASDNYLSLDVLSSYWNTGAVSTLLDEAFIVLVESGGIQSAGTHNETYNFAVQVSSTTNFAATVTVAQTTLPVVASTGTQGTEFVISVNRETVQQALNFLAAGSTVGYVRVYLTVGGGTPSIAWNSFVAPLVG